MHECKNITLHFASNHRRMRHNTLRNKGLRIETFFQNGYSCGIMRNEPKQTEPITVAQLRSVADELLRFAESLRLCAETAEKQPTKTLAVYYWNSAVGGLSRISSFVRAAEDSRRHAELGSPLAVGQLKPRSTAKAAKKKADQVFRKKSK